MLLKLEGLFVILLKHILLPLLYELTAEEELQMIYYYAFYYYYKNEDQHGKQLKQMKSLRFEKLGLKLARELLIYLCKQKGKSYSEPMVQWLGKLRKLRNFAKHISENELTKAKITKEWKKFEWALGECGRKLNKSGLNGQRYLSLRNEVEKFRLRDVAFTLDEGGL